MAASAWESELYPLSRHAICGNEELSQGPVCPWSNKSVDTETLAKLEQFTCKMYGQSKVSNLANARANMLRMMVGDGSELSSKSSVEFGRVPPCRSSLEPHIYRVNHRVAIFKREYLPNIEIPSPTDEKQGWVINDLGRSQPLWTIGPVISQSLIDLAESSIVEGGKADDSEDQIEIDSDYLDCSSESEGDEVRDFVNV